MLKVNGVMPKFNANHTKHLVITMDNSKGIKEIITITKVTTSTITTSKTTNSYQKETGSNLPETIPIKMDGLKVSLEMLKVNGYQLRSQLNHITLFPIKMDNSNMIKTMVKATTNNRTITNTKTTVTITKTTNRCHKVPGCNLLETIPIQMVYLELSLKMLKVNGVKPKFNANHTKHLVITMDNSKGIKEIITITKVTTSTITTTLTKTTISNHKVLLDNQPETFLIKTECSVLSFKTPKDSGVMLKFNVNQTKDSETTMDNSKLSID
jgi:hypothetical protein